MYYEVQPRRLRLVRGHSAVGFHARVSAKLEPPTPPLTNCLISVGFPGNLPRLDV